MSRLILCSALSLSLFAAPAFAQDKPAATPAVAKTSKYEKIVCKTMAETGSLIKRKKTCKSLAAWDREAEATRANNVSDSCSKRGDGGFCS